MTYVDWKQRVAKAFDAAAPTYDRAAKVQRILAGQLAQRILEAGIPDAPRVLEVGCGTGFLTQSLHPRLPGCSWLATDVAPAMVRACAQRFAGTKNFAARVMDAEAPDLEPGSFDLVCSSLAAQWFVDLPGTLQKLHGLLAPGGLLKLTLLGPETFEEWRDACVAEGITPATPDYPTPRDLRAMLGTDAWVREEWKTVPQESPRDFLRGLRDIGAQTPAPDRDPASPRDLRRVLGRLESEGFEVTYHVLTAAWRKAA